MYDFCATCKHRQPQVMDMHQVDPARYWCLMYTKQPEMCKAGRSCGHGRLAVETIGGGEASQESRRMTPDIFTGEIG